MLPLETWWDFLDTFGVRPIRITNTSFSDNVTFVNTISMYSQNMSQASRPCSLLSCLWQMPVLDVYKEDEPSPDSSCTWSKMPDPWGEDIFCPQPVAVPKPWGIGIDWGCLGWKGGSACYFNLDFSPQRLLCTCYVEIFKRVKPHL